MVQNNFYMGHGRQPLFGEAPHPFPIPNSTLVSFRELPLVSEGNLTWRVTPGVSPPPPTSPERSLHAALEISHYFPSKGNYTT